MFRCAYVQCTTRRANQKKTILSSPLLRLFGDQFPIILRGRGADAREGFGWMVGGQNRSFMNTSMSSGLASQEDCKLSQLWSALNTFHEMFSTCHFHPASSSRAIPSNCTNQLHWRHSTALDGLDGLIKGFVVVRPLRIDCSGLIYDHDKEQIALSRKTFWPWRALTHPSINIWRP